MKVTVHTDLMFQGPFHGHLSRYVTWTLST